MTKYFCLRIIYFCLQTHDRLRNGDGVVKAELQQQNVAENARECQSQVWNIHDAESLVPDRHIFRVEHVCMDIIYLQGVSE